MLLGIRVSICLLVCTLAAAPALAAPLAAVEGADFGNINSLSVDVGTLDVGVNTVGGSTGGLGDNADFFDAALPAGLEITSIDILVSALTDPPWRVIAANDTVGGFDFTLQAQRTETSAGLFSVPADLGSFPFPTGQYHFGLITFNNASFDYEVRVNVATAPEPSAGALLGLGLLSLLAARSRSR